MVKDFVIDVGSEVADIIAIAVGLGAKEESALVLAANNYAILGLYTVALQKDKAALEAGVNEAAEMLGAYAKEIGATSITLHGLIAAHRNQRQTILNMRDELSEIGIALAEYGKQVFTPDLTVLGLIDMHKAQKNYIRELQGKVQSAKEALK